MRLPLFVSVLLAILLTTSCAPGTETAVDDPPPEPGSSHAELVEFYHDWRAFQRPPTADGIPDYGSEAMASQHRSLGAWQEAVAAFDTSGWPVSERIDLHLVQAEMNGLDFDHRVLKPWQNNPAFYVQIWTYQSDTPAHEGPAPEGFIDIWTYDYPLSADAASELATRIRTIPPFLETARVNLTGNQRDLWTMGVMAMEEQEQNLRRLGERVAGASTELDAAIDEAANASAALAQWLAEREPDKSGPSGVGRDQYDWYLRHVHLIPHTWKDELRIMQQELARSYRALRFEENRNRDLPPLEPIVDAATYDRLLNEAVDGFVAFFEREQIMEIRPYMAPALRARIGSFSEDGPGSFFAQVNYRDARVMRTHGYHWIDLARMEAEPHPSPIRANPLLYNIWDSRSEGLSTAMEEFMMDAGMFDDSPRTRELIWILVAQRAARAISGLMMHANEWTLQEAADFAADWTPRGWMQADGDLVRFEQHLYLMQPGYGSSYLAGKAQIDELMSARQHQLGDAFTVSGFFDELNDTGLIPVSMIRWELTGDEAPVLALTAGND